MKLRVRATEALLIATILAVAPVPARAWIYPEHRDIAVAAVGRLAPTDQATLQQLWTEALPGYKARLCPKLSEGDQGLEPGCIDFAAFPALSGDHSCSPKDVLEHVLPSDWIVGVARVSAETKASLASATSRSAKLNATATNNLKLQVTDPEYATRAGSNNAHFNLPRESDELSAYVAACLVEGAPLNSLGLYAQYHIASLALAQRIASGQVADGERAATARDVLALEGFSLHWLEDIYAARWASVR